MSRVLVHAELLPATQLANIKRGESFDVYIGRRGHGYDGYFGNPCAAPSGDRLASIEAFRQHFLHQVEHNSVYRSRVTELRGKVLGCFCTPRSCHGDVYVAYLDAGSHEAGVAAVRDLRDAPDTDHPERPTLLRETASPNTWRS